MTTLTISISAISQRLLRHSFRICVKSFFIVVQRYYLLWLLMASTTFVRDARQAGMPLLSRFSMKQNSNAIMNVDGCSRIVRSICGGFRVWAYSSENKELLNMNAKQMLNRNPRMPAIRVTAKFSTINCPIIPERVAPKARRTPISGNSLPQPALGHAAKIDCRYDEQDNIHDQP